MYSLKVRGTQRKEDNDTPAEDSEEAGTSSQQSISQAPSPTQPENTSVSEEVEQLSFSAGNPRVEHITGVVHLYRHFTDDQPTEESSQDGHRPSASGSLLPQNRSNQLCVLSLPPDMGFPEFCTFLGAYFDHVRDIRLVRRDSAAKSTCLVLLTFDAQKAADGFYEDFNGKPFCMLEPEFVCRLLYVKDVEITEGTTKNATPPVGSHTSTQAKASSPASTTAPTPPPGATELPSCPVCLERLDEHISGVVTTVCNHKFHNQCLRQWVDTSCPVCRYCQHPTENTSHCASCGTSADLWICLICGHVGCGRYRGSHAENHWQESGHGYSLELETQRVWDYASDAYVHRLVRSKTDGKIVEVSAPGARGGECSAAGAECGGECSRHSTEMGLDPEVEEAIVLSKLDVLAAEYNHLLVSQLDSQRQHFEGMLEKQRLEYEGSLGEALAKVESSSAEAASAAAATAEAERRRQQLESKLRDVSAQLKSSQKEKEFLKELNDTLLSNQKEFSTKLKAADAKAAEQTATITDLQEQVRDLMVFIEAQQTIAASGGGEVAGGTVLPLPPSPQRKGGRRKK